MSSRGVPSPRETISHGPTNIHSETHPEMIVLSPVLTKTSKESGDLAVASGSAEEDFSRAAKSPPSFARVVDEKQQDTADLKAFTELPGSGDLARS